MSEITTKISELINSVIVNANLNSLANMYECLNKWVVPDEFWAVLNPPDYIKHNFSNLPNDIKNNTIEPIMEKVKAEIIRKSVSKHKSIICVNNGQTWEDYKREH